MPKFKLSFLKFVTTSQQQSKSLSQNFEIGCGLFFEKKTQQQHLMRCFPGQGGEQEQKLRIENFTTSDTS